MITEGIKKLLGDELASQVEAALKGKGKEGKDVDLVVGNDGSYVPADKYDAANQSKSSAETTMKSVAEALKAIGGSGDPSKIADDVKAAQSKIDELGKNHKAELNKIQRTAALKMSLVGKVHDPDDIIKLLDLEKIDVDDSGCLKTNVDDLIKPYKDSKPYLFVDDQSTQQTQINGAKPAGAGSGIPQNQNADLNSIRQAMGLPTT